MTRITAAVLERKRLGSEIVIIARTDALQTHNFDKAIRRLKAAIQADADVAFMEGVTTEDEVQKHVVFLHLLRCWVVEHGATPSWTPGKANELGVKIIIFPFAAIAPAYKAIGKGLQRIKDTGTTGIAADFKPKKLFTAVGLKEATEIDVAAGGIFVMVYNRMQRKLDVTACP